MVRNTRKKAARGFLLVLSLFICGWAALAAPAAAAEATIKEEYTVTINEVGDARIEDVIQYSPDDFEVIQDAMKENPKLLTRRYTTDSNIGEVVDFKADLDKSRNAVVIKFRTPGYAYNMRDYWVVFGFPEKPVRESRGKLTFETEGETNSELTLFTDQTIESRTVVKLPLEARNTGYDSEEKAIKWEMPAGGAALGFWSENRTLLAVIFGACTVLFAGFLLFVRTRKPEPAPAAATAPSGAPPSTAAAPTPPPAAATAKRFCTKCGAEIAPGRHFCTHCGAEQ